MKIMTRCPKCGSHRIHVEDCYLEGDDDEVEITQQCDEDDCGHLWAERYDITLKFVEALEN